MFEVRKQLNAFTCLCPFTCDFFTFHYHFVVIWSLVTFYCIWDFATGNHFLWDLPRALQNACVFKWFITLLRHLHWLCMTWACQLCSLWNKMFDISCLLCWIRLNKVVSFKIVCFDLLEQDLFFLSQSVSWSGYMLCQILLFYI